MFGSWPDGLQTLTRALVDGLPVEVRLGTRVVGITRHGRSYTVSTESTESTESADAAEALDVDGVVLAIPARAAAPAPAPPCPDVGPAARRGARGAGGTVVVGFGGAGIRES
jgi:oxygen-dependent protoporphyrinogen oxidase